MNMNLSCLVLPVAMGFNKHRISFAPFFFSFATIRTFWHDGIFLDFYSSTDECVMVFHAIAAYCTYLPRIVVLRVENPISSYQMKTLKVEQLSDT